MGKLNVDGTEIQVLQIDEDDYTQSRCPLDILCPYFCPYECS